MSDSPPSGCVEPEKTALLNFDASLLQGTGRPAKKPATFTFLGFTHFRARTRAGKVHVGRTPSVKARSASSQESPNGYGSTATKASGNTRRI
jgi:hypothetical protein